MSEQQELNAPSECPHEWEAAGMAFETQLLDERGRVLVRQPDLEAGRCYMICRKCACHTYLTTQWIGYQLYGSEQALNDLGLQGHVPGNGYNRPAWKLEDGA